MVPVTVVHSLREDAQADPEYLLAAERHGDPSSGWRRYSYGAAAAPEPGGVQEAADFVAVPAGGVRLVVHRGTPDLRGRRVAEEFLLNGNP